MACDCGDYCEWCHPEMCGHAGEIALEELSEILKTLREIRAQLKQVERML